MLETLVAARLLLGLVFLGSAVPKLLDLARFRRVLASYALLPDRTLRPLAIALPVVELALGAGFLGGWDSRLIGATADGLLILFVGAITVNLLRHNAIDCGCGGWERPTRIGWHVVARDLILAFLSTAIVFHPPASLSMLLEQHRITASDLIAVAVCAELVVIVSSVMGNVVHLFAVSRAVFDALGEGEAL